LEALVSLGGKGLSFLLDELKGIKNLLQVHTVVGTFLLKNKDLIGFGKSLSGHE
jgi:hypothetical protein